MGPNAEELLVLSRRLTKLLEEPEFGLLTWYLMVQDTIKKIAAFSRDYE
jgi:hypothetical protein